MTDDNSEIDWSEAKQHGEKMEFSFSFEIEGAPRDVRKAFGMDDTVEMETDIDTIEDGEYRPCHYCEGDSWVYVDHYEDHLRDIHGIEP